MAEISPWMHVGRAEEALAVMVTLLEECDELGYLPLRAEVLLGLGDAQSAAGLVSEAASTLREAAFTALEAGHDRVGARAAMFLIRVEGIERSDYDAAALWTEHAKAVVSRLAEPGRVATELEYRQCRVLSDQGDIEGALPHCRAAVALSTANVGPEHIDTVSARLALGIAFYMAGDLDEAEPRFRAALVASRALHGPSHPSQAVPLQALAAICYSRDGGAACVDPFERAYRAAVAGSGPRHPAVADYANNLALAYLGAGRVDDAEVRARQAMVIREATGEAHPGIAASHRILGEIAVKRAQPELAREHYDAAIDGARRTRGPKHHDVVAGLRLRATLALEQGDRVSAIADLEAALVAQEGITMPPEDLAELQWKLGQALLVEDPAARIRAVRLVREAQQGYPASAVTQHAAVAAWLREHAVGLPLASELAVER
ncbi:MAG: tetratricopeptide repeat protein [Nannocystaceae bacterium]|nr:tetratricopeptide repeat protein [Nannocystaceae bacterium]